MLSRWQSTIVDAQGNVQPLANLTVRNEADQSLAKMWASPGTTQPLPDGMVQAGGNGFAYFYAEGGLYRITSVPLGIDWRHVPLGTAASRDVGTARFDNDNSLATTAFVKQAGLQMSEFYSYASGTSIPVSAVGAPIQLTQASTQTYVVPLANSCPSGSVLYFTNTGTGAALISRSGSDTFAVGSGSDTGITILTGEQLMLTSNGNDQWVATGGSAAFLFSAGFNHQKAASGFQRLPSGLIIQWGGTGPVPSGSSAAVSYPIAFPSAVFTVLLSPSVGGNIGVEHAYGADRTSLSAFTAHSYASNGGDIYYMYVAIGH